MLTRLVLVLSLYLEDVEEVGGGGVDLDEIFIVFGDRVRQILDL